MDARICALEHALSRPLPHVRRRQASDTTAQAAVSATALADLLTQLPQLKTTDAGTVDFDASDSAVVHQLAEHADTACKTVLRGMAAIGSLLAHAGPEIEDGTITPDTLEALGLFLAEMGEVSGMLVALSGRSGAGHPPAAAV